MSLSGKKGKGIFILCVFSLGVLAAFRSPIVGNDTLEYIRIFESCDEMLSSGSRFEIGYLMYNSLIRQISNNVQVFFIITSIIIFTTYGIYIWKYSSRPKLAFLLFFILSFPGTVNTMRQCIAICFLLFSLESVVNRKLFVFIFYVLLASFFHATAILFIFVYPLSYLKINRMTLSLFAICALSGYLLFADLLNIGFSYFSMYEYYSQGKYFEGETRVASVVKFIFSIIIFSLGYYAYCLKSEDWKNTKEGKRYALFLLMAVIAVCIDFVSLRVNLIDRLDLYFTCVSFVLISNSICILPPHSRRIIAISILFLFVFYNCVAMSLRPDWNRVYPIELEWNL